MKILKFGGTSVANAKVIKNTLSIINNKAREETIAVVVSAFSGVTNTILEIADLASQSESN